jgi:hypothetical protein
MYYTDGMCSLYVWIYDKNCSKESATRSSANSAQESSTILPTEISLPHSKRAASNITKRLNSNR